MLKQFNKVNMTEILTQEQINFKSTITPNINSNKYSEVNLNT